MNDFSLQAVFLFFSIYILCTSCLIAWLFNGRNHKSASTWITGNLLTATATFVTAFRLNLPEWVGVVGANMLQLMSYICWGLALQAVGRPLPAMRRSMLQGAGWVLLFGFAIYLLWAHSNRSAWITLSSSSHIAALVWTSVMLKRNSRRERDRGGLLLMRSLLMISASLWLVRIPVSFLGLAQSPLDPFVINWLVFVLLMITVIFQQFAYLGIHLSHAYEERLALAETLEQRVMERTEELRATNAELESFGYSVSHDLKAPLRSIQGFVVLMERRLKGKLDPEEHHFFERIQANVFRMHELIIDLLALARASQGQLTLSQVDLTHLARKILSQEQQQNPSRHLTVSLQDDVTAHCDAQFCKIVMENLLGNAVKYSRNNPHAVIEFGCLPQPVHGRRMLYVKDNGAGFNMDYATNLFKPFHRLHHDSEFEGSGIGLATVHRILERHGGTIYAQSAEGAGATFYFSFDPLAGSDRSL